MRRRFRPSLGRLQPKTNTKDGTTNKDGSSGNESTTPSGNQPTRRARIKPKVGIVGINRNVDQQSTKPAVKRPTIQVPLDKQTTKTNNKTENALHKDSQNDDTITATSVPQQNSHRDKQSDSVDKSQSNNQHKTDNSCVSSGCDQTNIGQNKARNNSGSTKSDKPQKAVLNKEARLEIKLMNRENNVDNTSLNEQSVNRTTQGLKELSSCPEPQLLINDSFPCVPVLIDNDGRTKQTQVASGINLSEFDKIHTFNDLIQHLLEDTNDQTSLQNNETLLHTDVACLTEPHTKKQQEIAPSENSTPDASTNTMINKDRGDDLNYTSKLNTKRRYKPRKPKQVKDVYNNISTLLQYDISEIPIASNVIICDDNVDKQAENVDHPVLELPVDLIEKEEATCSTPKRTMKTKSLKQRFKQKHSNTVKLVVSRETTEEQVTPVKQKSTTAVSQEASTSQAENTPAGRCMENTGEMQKESSIEDTVNTSQYSVNISLPSTTPEAAVSDVATDSTVIPSEKTVTECTTNIVNENTTSLNTSLETGNESRANVVERPRSENETQVSVRRKRASAPNVKINRKQTTGSNNIGKTVEVNSATKEVEPTVVPSSELTTINKQTTTLLTTHNDQDINSTVDSALKGHTTGKQDDTTAENVVNEVNSLEVDQTSSSSHKTSEHNETIATSKPDETNSILVEQSTKESDVHSTQEPTHAQHTSTDISGKTVRKRWAGMPNINITRKRKTLLCETGNGNIEVNTVTTSSECENTTEDAVLSNIGQAIHHDITSDSMNNKLDTPRRRRISTPNINQTKKRKADENETIPEGDTPCHTRDSHDNSGTATNQEQTDKSMNNETSITQNTGNIVVTDPNTSNEQQRLSRKRKIGPNLTNMRQRGLKKADLNGDTNTIDTSNNSMVEPLHGTNVPSSNDSLNVTTSSVIESSSGLDGFAGSNDLQDISLNVTENINNDLSQPLSSVGTTNIETSLQEELDDSVCVRKDVLENEKAVEEEAKNELTKKRGRPKGRKTNQSNQDITADQEQGEEGTQTNGVKQRNKNAKVPAKRVRKKGKDVTEKTTDDNVETQDNTEEHGETPVKKKRKTKNTSSNNQTTDNEHTKLKGRKAHRSTKEVDNLHITEMRISDLAYYNPRTNPMKETGNEGSFLNASARDEEVRPLETQPDDAPTTTTTTTSNDGDSQPSEVLAPQVTIDADGNIVLDEDSLMIRSTTPTENLGNREVVFENKHQQFRSGRKRYNMTRWKKEETLHFYDVLSQVGTDFSLMAKLFENRDRSDLKKKFKREEKYNRDLVEKALSQRNPISAELFKDCLEENEAEIEQSFEVNSDENVK